PAFVVLAGDDLIDSGDRLDQLRDELRDVPEDVAIWDTKNHTLAAAVVADKVTLFKRPAEANAANNHANGNGKKPRRQPLPRLFATYTVTQILIWMGSDGWSAAEAKAVLDLLRAGVSSKSANSLTSAGRTGRLQPPNLAPRVIRRLRRLRRKLASNSTAQAAQDQNDGAHRPA